MGEQEAIMVITTTDSPKVAERIARGLLEKRLAACVQLVGPVRSLYWWKGAIESSEELVLFIKSRAGLYDELEGVIRKLHNYEVPEIIAFAAREGLQDYIDWLNSTLARP